MTLTPAILWFFIGASLCLLELLFPTAYVAFVMGLSALAVGLIALVLPQISLQIGLWMAGATALIFLMPRWLPKSQGRVIQEETAGKTLTAIQPGQVGRVLYEGNSWQALCEDPKLAIAADQKVYVLRREGTTLIVLPEHLLHAEG
ncbi:hypothetical protein DO97_04605 [Neosynechococcus sphagnicola sy1]|uniref:NfeD-like C-terminal domain-containing protein n=1 Tax=Neosynechococcus sphagnicola sy1 TaxID=1497020 RepID=A0A098TPL8_9CYAN|nr:NfeD family protein [Neosynechococcus sphagnicola]KGF72778.1 hypothetical protein DO97_04605 [Neosynechococcus sphagnicola sy1]